MNSKQVQIKRQVTGLVLAITILVISAAPVLADFDIGTGLGDYRPATLETKYPAGMLKAELPD